jgi:hypothetical protein
LLTLFVWCAFHSQNADIVYEETLPRIKASLTNRANPKEVPIVTGFLGRGQTTGGAGRQVLCLLGMCPALVQAYPGKAPGSGPGHAGMSNAFRRSVPA